MCFRSRIAPAVVAGLWLGLAPAAQAQTAGQGAMLAKALAATASGDWSEALRKAAGRRGRARAARLRRGIVPVKDRKAVLAAALARKRR